MSLKPYYDPNPSILEIGVDEAGRGPLLGRVYAAAVLLPKDDSFDHSQMKDSKKFHSKKKIEEVAAYIKQHAIAYAVAFEDEQTVDSINILQATQNAMHAALRQIITEKKEPKEKEPKEKEPKEKDGEPSFFGLIDGNYFRPMNMAIGGELPHVCCIGGDNHYSSIAAASILAKVSRDQYIESLSSEHPELCEKYNIHKNKGYGTKAHMAAIKEHGLTPWHRQSFCKRISVSCIQTKMKKK